MTRPPSDIRYDKPVNNCTPPFIVVSKVFTPKECAEIISIGNSKALEPAKIASGQVETEIRSSDLRFIEPINLEKIGFIFERLKEIIDNVNDRVYEYELKYFAPPQFTVYQKNDFYDWHMDLMMSNPCPNLFMRKLSASVFLSSQEDFTGGEFMIGRKSDGTHENIIANEQGAVVLFPSFMWHKVNPVLSGQRFSLVVWCEGDKFK